MKEKNTREKKHLFTTNGLKLKGLYRSEVAAEKEFEPSHSHSNSTINEFWDFSFLYCETFCKLLHKAALTLPPLHAAYYKAVAL